MEPQQARYPRVTAHVENIGGIRKTSVDFSPGITLLVGRNATNRTSFLQAVMAALGSENVAIKGDAEEATVELTLGNETFTRQLRRRAGAVVTDGDPYLDDPTLADLFAFLLESNESRRAVTASDDLRELIMRPVDTEAIQHDIDRLVEERDTLKEELADIDEDKGKLPKLEEKRTQLRAEIDEKKARLEEKEAEIEAANADIDETRSEKAKLQKRLEELRTKRATLDDVRYELETERESLDALTRERRELETELDGLPETPVGEIDDIETDLRRLREQKQALEAEVTDLQSVISFNEEMLDGGETIVSQGLFADAPGDITDQLLPENEITCWTCGSNVETTQIESTLDQLRRMSQTKLAEVAELESEISDLTSRKHTLEESQRDRDRIERRLTSIEDEIASGESTIDRLQSRRDDLTQEIESIEADVEELEDKEDSTVLELHREANQLEYELGTLESDLERVESDIGQIESRIDRRTDVEAQLEEVKAEIEELRTKIERIEASAIEEFNDHMDTILGVLDYSNLDRIWIERVERDIREGRQTVTERIFELHVIRTSESGTAYEDTVDHLSESEREVTGLVFGLAGFLAHEVYEVVPFMLLDSLEAIDSSRIATLVDYLGEYTEYLLVALLPEDAAALSDDYERVTEI